MKLFTNVLSNLCAPMGLTIKAIDLGRIMPFTLHRSVYPNPKHHLTMHVFGRRFAASLLGLALLNSLASAATITGRVRDSNNSYLLGATISVKELDRSTSSVAGGTFAVSNVPAGTYTVTVSSMGFKDATQTVTIADGSNA